MTKPQLLQRKIAEIADCAIITDDVNRRYFTGMKSSAGILLVFPEESVLLIDSRYIEKARRTALGCTVVLEDVHPMQQISKLLKARGAKAIAIDSESCTVSQLNNYKKSLDAEIVSDNKLCEIIRQIRLIKTPEEIEKMISAQRIAEKGFEHMLEFIGAGKTEREIQLELDFYMLSHGAEALSFDTIALSGSNTSLPHGTPSDKPVKQGEFVLLDFGTVVDGWHSDMTRTVCVGKPTEKMEMIYDIVLKAQLAALREVRAGITGIKLDKIARDIISSHGYGENFGHSLGHGVGMQIHESPYASVVRKNILPENSIITVEPGIYLEGEFGVRIEDFVVVKADGCVNMTNSPKNLICL